MSTTGDPATRPAEPPGAPSPGPRDIGGETRSYLASHNTVSLATVGPDGPWATSVFYVSLGLTLYFLSEPKTRHVQNLAHSPSLAATVNEDYRDWQQIKGMLRLN